MKRFPFGYPNSWFRILFSDELPKGMVKPLHYFGQDLVAFRGEDGAAHVLDAHCAHLGAHIGYGGAVVGNTVRCPFHNWRYDGTGRCIEVPYAKKIPPKAQIRPWHTREHSGMLFLWHHQEGAPPDWEVPVIGEYGNPDYTRAWHKRRWTVKTHPQEVMENALDWPHFHFVHKTNMFDQRTHRFDGRMFHWTIGARKNVQTMGDATDSFFMEAWNWGLGWNYIRYAGLFTTVVSGAMTPIDEETIDYTTCTIGKKDGRSDDEATAALKAYMDDQAIAVEQDFEIWEHKKFRPHPVLCDGDGPIGEFRRWARQFYASGQSAATATAAAADSVSRIE